MDPLSASLATLMVTWTDPAVIAGGVIALALVGFAAFAARRSGSPEPQRSTQELRDQVEAQRAREDPAGASEPEASERAPEAEGAGEENLARGRGRTLAELVASEEVDDASLLSRFVLDSKGETVGETLTVTEDEVILKHDGAFLAVSLEAVIEKNGTLLADGNIDWEQAEADGEAWRSENLDRMEYDETGMPVSS